MKSVPTNVLKNLSLDIKKGELVAVIGDVGSGKSSFLYSLIGEMKCDKSVTSLTLNGSVAIVN